jgi:hypothetical protein
VVSAGKRRAEGYSIQKYLFRTHRWRSPNLPGPLHWFLCHCMNCLTVCGLASTMKLMMIKSSQNGKHCGYFLPPRLNPLRLDLGAGLRNLVPAITTCLCKALSGSPPCCPSSASHILPSFRDCYYKARDFLD